MKLDGFLKKKMSIGKNSEMVKLNNKKRNLKSYFMSFDGIYDEIEIDEFIYNLNDDDLNLKFTDLLEKFLEKKNKEFKEKIKLPVPKWRYWVYLLLVVVIIFITLLLFGKITIHFTVFEGI